MMFFKKFSHKTTESKPLTTCITTERTSRESLLQLNLDDFSSSIDIPQLQSNKSLEYVGRDTASKNTIVSHDLQNQLSQDTPTPDYHHRDDRCSSTETASSTLIDKSRTHINTNETMEQKKQEINRVVSMELSQKMSNSLTKGEVTYTPSDKSQKEESSLIMIKDTVPEKIENKPFVENITKEEKGITPLHDDKQVEKQSVSEDLDAENNTPNTIVTEIALDDTQDMSEYVTKESPGMHVEEVINSLSITTGVTKITHDEKDSTFDSSEKVDSPLSTCSENNDSFIENEVQIITKDIIKEDIQDALSIDISNETKHEMISEEKATETVIEHLKDKPVEIREEEQLKAVEPSEMTIETTKARNKVDKRKSSHSLIPRKHQTPSTSPVEKTNASLSKSVNNQEQHSLSNRRASQGSLLPIYQKRLSLTLIDDDSEHQSSSSSSESKKIPSSIKTTCFEKNSLESLSPERNKSSPTGIKEIGSVNASQSSKIPVIFASSQGTQRHALKPLSSVSVASKLPMKRTMV